MSLAGTPLLRTEPPDGRRQQLIETTIVVLAEFGYVGTTLGRIGARAGVSAGLVAHYFGDKDTLLEAAFRTLVARVRGRVIERLGHARTPRERVEAVIDANLAPHEFEPQVAAAWLAPDPAVALCVVAAAILLLLGVGIHNAWDTVVYLTARAGAAPAPPTAAPPNETP